MASTQPSQLHEPGASSGSPVGVKGSKHVAHLVLFFPERYKELDGKGAVETQTNTYRFIQKKYRIQR